MIGRRDKDLFGHARDKRIEKEQPLAARMRPRTLDEYIGQEHILAPGRLLNRAIVADRISSLIFYGPPGTGKTTLASVIANTTKSHFEVLNAVLSGVKDVRDVTEAARTRRGEFGRRTILFVDEVHRWNKAQQDALLPWVENGTIVLIGATTENPYFTVNRALVSRSRIFQLKPLTGGDLHRVAAMALADPERGYGELDVDLHADALDHLVGVANGDARALLNALELAVETTPPDAAGRIVIDMAVAEESIQQRAVLYDKEGDYHFDTISAFIKSLRGSDPDATLYWLAKMVYAGEDPRFIFRRMLIFCGEDVGLADPGALTVVQSAAEAFDRVGMPEGRYHLGFAALYLATAPKSNSVMGFFDALASVEKEREGEVPNHLRDASRDKEGFGHGEGYLYPHAYRDHWVAQQYLPDGLQGKMFYNPGRLGHEAEICEDVSRRREAQLAAAVDRNAGGAPPEILSFSPQDRQFEQWLARTVSGAGDRLAEIRDRIFASFRCERHWVVADLTADTGLLTWEALRHTPEGQVWSVVSNPNAAAALNERAGAVPDLRRPRVVISPDGEFAGVAEAAEEDGVRFEALIGRNAMGRAGDKATVLKRLLGLLRPGGVLALAESVPRHTQRLYRLLPATALPEDVANRLAEAEEAIYADPLDPMVNWDVSDLRDALTLAGFVDVEVEPQDSELRQVISDRMVAGWFSAGSTDGRATYRARLEERLDADEVETVRRAFEIGLGGTSVEWVSKVAFLRARAPSEPG